MAKRLFFAIATLALLMTFSTVGRALDKADDNEFVLIEAGDLLKAE